MKDNRRLFNRLAVCAVAFAMVSTLAAQTIGSAKVIRIKGPARFSTGNNIWQPLGVGAVLQPGTVVQTSTEKGSYVDIVLGEANAAVVQPVTYRPGIVSSMASASANYQPSVDQNVIRIWENSALGIDKLSSMQTGAEVVTDTQLDLKAGRVTGNVRKMSAASKYEIKMPNGVAGIRGTLYDIYAEGIIKIFVGSAVAAAVDSKSGNVTTQTVMGGQQYDMRSNQITPISAADMSTVDALVAALTPTITAAPTVLASDKTIITVSPVR
jgi:FecR-like protein